LLLIIYCQRSLLGVGMLADIAQGFLTDTVEAMLDLLR
jgi:hypothetical protein